MRIGRLIRWCWNADAALTAGLITDKVGQSESQYSAFDCNRLMPDSWIDVNEHNFVCVKSSLKAILNILGRIESQFRHTIDLKQYSWSFDVVDQRNYFQSIQSIRRPINMSIWKIPTRFNQNVPYRLLDITRICVQVSFLFFFHFFFLICFLCFYYYYLFIYYYYFCFFGWDKPRGWFWHWPSSVKVTYDHGRGVNNDNFIVNTKTRNETKYEVRRDTRNTSVSYTHTHTHTHTQRDAVNTMYQRFCGHDSYWEW